MPNRSADRSRTLLSQEEIRAVSGCFRTDKVLRAQAFNKGSHRFPKAVVECAGGLRFLLKRRALSEDNIARLRFSHSVQLELEKHHFPMPNLQRTGAQATWIAHGQFIYELFNFVAGERYLRSVAESRESGLLLSRLHRTLHGWSAITPSPRHTGYHNSRAVSSAWDRVAPAVMSVDPTVSATELGQLCQQLRDQYTQAAAAAEVALSANAESSLRSIIHGDFHPGNILFFTGSAIALLDFDSVRFDRTIFDIANGVLQFGMQGANRKLGSNQDPSLNMEGIQGFLAGYAWSGQSLPRASECPAIPALMIEAGIAEVIPRVAHDGALGSHPAIDYLRFLTQRSQWIWSARAELTTLCTSCATD